jgi:DNA adenine methylase
MHNPSSQTPIAFYGGKIALLSRILPMVPPHEVYTESFLGGASLFFAKEKVKNETINDISDFVINFYVQTKTNFARLKPLIEATLVSRTQHRQAIQIYKKPNLHGPLEKAWAFWFITNFSFANKPGGGIKYSNNQNTVVPEQMRNKKARFTEWLVHRIEDAHIENNTASFVLKSRNVSNAFHYIDPPYFNADMGPYPGFTENDLIDILDICKEIKGRFLLSNYNSEILDSYIEKYGWYKQEITKRMMAPKIRTKFKTEVLVSNYSKTCLMANRLFN